MSLEPGCPDCAAIGQRCGFHMSTLEDERAVLEREVRRLRAENATLHAAAAAVTEAAIRRHEALAEQPGWEKV